MRTDITEQLKAERLAHKLSLARLAERVGTSRTHLHAIEGGSIDPRISSVMNWARALDLELMLIPKHIAPTVKGLIQDADDHNRSAKETRSADIGISWNAVDSPNQPRFQASEDD